MASTSSTTSTDRWDALGPAADPKAGVEDFCAKGATTCFILEANKGSKIASGTPGHEDIVLGVSNPQQPAAGYDSSRAPTKGGLGLNGLNTRFESTGAFPIYEDQDFGVEIWYRRAPNITFPRRMMLAQVHRKIWIQEWLDGGISCYMTNEDGTPQELQHVYKPSTSQMDELRHVACFVHEGHAYLLINGYLQQKGPNTGQPFYKPVTNDRPPELSFGIWAAADVNGSSGFVPLKGTMYMARTWNNMTKMKNAFMQELPYHGFPTAGLESFRPKAP